MNTHIVDNLLAILKFASLALLCQARNKDVMVKCLLRIVTLMIPLLIGVSLPARAYAEQALPITDLSIEDLVSMKVPEASQKEQVRKKMLNVKVSSVAKSSQALSNAAAAVFVIDNEAIKRSGVTSVPEALRLAPGIDMARINNSKWAVTARGFNGRFANKLLVLIDGRSVYTPDFSGVYWDAQDVMLEDVDRIEIIRGPGATLWGANAMNGVINIITKHAEDTQGGLISAGSGSQELGFGSLRYGKRLAEDTYARMYAKGFLRDTFATEKLASGDAQWRQFQGGFRLDSSLSNQDNLMLQGNVYQGDPEQAYETFALKSPKNDPVTTAGWNITSRFNHNISSTADYSLQFYYDHYQRQEYTVDVLRNTIDLDFQNNFALDEQQNIIWGLGYRYTEDHFGPRELVTFNPSVRNTQLFSAFLQDEVSFFNDALLLTIGSKFEHNDYTGFEGQPSVSLMWTPTTGHKLWASISRAVRTPSRAEANSRFVITSVPPKSASNPLPLALEAVVIGNADFKAEQQLSYQLGYRFMFSNNISWDIAAFYNEYTTLRSSSYGKPTLNLNRLTIEQPVIFNNISNGNTYGFETTSVWQMLDWWRWDLNYSFLQTEINHVEEYQAAISPEHMVSLRAGINPVEKVNLDFWLRYASSAKTVNSLGRELLNVSDYVTLDVRLAWQPISNVELSIVGQNLLQDHHIEYFDESYALPAGVPRAVYGKISWQF